MKVKQRIRICYEKVIERREMMTFLKKLNSIHLHFIILLKAL